MIQKGAQPVHLRPGDSRRTIGIKLNDQASKDVLDYWGGLAKKGLVGTQDQFTTGVHLRRGQRQVRHLRLGGLGARLPHRRGRRQGRRTPASSAVAPLPQWDPANPVAVNWGGSAFAVTSQAKNRELAAKVAYGLYADEESLTDGWKNQIIFPLNLERAEATTFVNAEGASSSTASRRTRRSTCPAANAYKGVIYSPFSQYYYDAMHQADQRAHRGLRRPARRPPTDLQEDVVKYAKEQGFTVQ